MGPKPDPIGGGHWGRMGHEMVPRELRPIIKADGLALEHRDECARSFGVHVPNSKPLGWHWSPPGIQK